LGCRAGIAAGLRISEGAVEGAAVDQKVLTRDVAGLRRAQKCAGRAELVRIAEALGGDASHTGSRDFCLAFVLLLGGLVQRATQTVGIEGAGQDIVDGDVLVRDFARDTGEKGRESGAGPRR